MTSRRILERLRREDSRRHNNGVRIHASDVRNCGDEAWSKIPEELIDEVRDRLGMADIVEVRMNRELERLMAVAPQREGVNSHLELAIQIANGTLGVGRERETPVDASTQRSHTMALMMRKYAPTK